MANTLPLSEEFGNNLYINIPKLLTEKYPNWIYLHPQIYQLDEDFKIIKTWDNKKQIADHYKKKIQGVELAIRKSCRFKGFYWVIKILYDKEGLRPLLTEKRNTPIYTYDPPLEILDNYWNFKISDFWADEWKNKFRFIGRFPNSVAASKFLDLSVTNIRRVSKEELILHKGYFFSFNPILEIHQLTADIVEYTTSNSKGLLKEGEEVKLFSCIERFKEIYSEEGRIVSSMEKKLWNLFKDKNPLDLI